MQINRIGKGISIFCLTFLIGFCAVDWFAMNQLSNLNQAIEQKFISAKNKIETPQNGNCVPVKPTPENLRGKEKFLREMYEHSEREVVKVWLQQHTKSSPKERKSHIEKQIYLESFQEYILREFNGMTNNLSLDMFGQDEDSKTQNLLYLEKCY